jgi:hypothetical protein
MDCGNILEGKGVAQSVEYAYAWWTIAKASGVEGVEQNLLMLQGDMTYEQVERGQQLAREISNVAR